MEPIRLGEAAAAMGAEAADAAEVAVHGICTDTREGAAGSLFFALRGENTDGHQYVQRAFQMGAAAAVVEQSMDDAGGPKLVVPDALEALGALAGWYRGRFRIPIVGVTGSVGKTSTKEMIAQALGGRYRLLVSERNFNNEIGVPRTLFGLDSGHSAAVVEMAMRGRGQIASLAAMAKPQIGVVTNIGVSHVELLGSREEIAAAKAELLEALPADGTAIINADDDFAGFLKSRSTAPVVTFGVRNPADFQAEKVRFGSGGEPSFRIRGQEFHIPSAGVHHVANAACACAVASALGVSLAETAERLAAFRPPAMRMEVADLPNGVTLLNDAYNAAPDSMRAALETLSLMAKGRRAVAVLGDMRELGAETETAHRYVGQLAAEAELGLLVTVGEAAGLIAKEAEKSGVPSESYPDSESAAAEIGSHVHPRDVILVKGSRAMQMERVVEALRNAAILRYASTTIARPC